MSDKIEHEEILVDPEKSWILGENGPEPVHMGKGVVITNTINLPVARSSGYTRPADRKEFVLSVAESLRRTVSGPGSPVGQLLPRKPIRGR
jgi:hypothetical protein